MKKITALLVAFSWAHLAQAQLVNIESKRMQTDSVRFALMADLNFYFSDQNGETYFSLGSNLTTQLKSKDLRHIYFVTGSANLVRAEGNDFQNSWFLHGRYNHKFTKLFRVEAFVQYQNNQLLVIDSQFLAGGGVRLKLINREQVSGYLGNSVMYEIENSQEYDQQNTNLRNSTYFTLTYAPGENKIHLVITVYFQPLYSDFSNYRILEQFLLELPVSKALSLTATFNYSLISVTPADTQDSTSNVRFGVRYALPPGP